MANLIAQEISSVWSGARLKLLNEQMAALLNQIHPIAGVREAVLYNNHGWMLGAVVADPPADRQSRDLQRDPAGPRGAAPSGAEDTLEKARYNQAGQYLAQVFAAFEQGKGRPKEIEMRFTRKELLARDLGNAFVAIGCAPEVDWAMLRLTLNVAAARFEKDTALQENLRQVAASRLDVLADVKATASRPSGVGSY